MENQRRSVFSSRHSDIWRRVEPSIWTASSEREDMDRALAVLKTLLDDPRWLEPYHLYDDHGSRLFEKICELPEYYLTRTETALLKEGAAEIIRAARAECIVELGAGNSQKTLHLLEEQVKQRRGGAFAPIDVSLPGLRSAREAIGKRFPQLAFHGLLGKYEDGIASIEKNLPTLFVFLGSTIGNFNHSEFVAFFEHLSASMGPEDYFLLGVDRIKDPALLEQAYDDSQGLTAEFILNVFQNVNRLLGSNFERGRMRYHSRYNRELRQVEMFALSTENQRIVIPCCETSFVWEKEEPILVEISRKFDPDRVQEQLRCFGLSPIGHFTDAQKWFSLLLFQKDRRAGASMIA
jgi:dimethylhistidine N-methyltransferase